MRPDEFLAVASLIEQRLPATEAVQRSIVNRLYYCAHHEVARMMVAAGPRTPGHADVIRRLVAIDPGAGAILNELYRRRRTADYDLDAAWLSGTSRETFDLLHTLRRAIGTG